MMESKIMTITRRILVLTLVMSVGASSSAEENKSESARINRLVVHADKGKEVISRNIYGHFAEHLGRCIYGGIWVGENSNIANTRGIRDDVVAALKRIKIPVLRWPGGCFADEYHWRDGIGLKGSRPCMVNTHWGMVTEDNHFGTHEFMDLCEQLGCQAYICGNVGSGTVQEMQQWVEYLTFAGESPMASLRRRNGRDEPWKIRYWGVGNENWGCGGCMRPEYYADLYSRYQNYIRNFSGNKIYKIACGSYHDRYDWTEILMREAGSRMNGFSYHYYCGSGKKSRSATVFDEGDWFELLRKALRMEEFVEKHSAIMDKYDPDKRVGLIVDEWGTWHAVEEGTNPRFLYQQNTLRDALVAAVTLNIFNNHCDRVKMANIAQTVNVLQAMILTKDEKMILTPSYHVFDMYKVHHDATLIPVELQCSDYRFGSEQIPALNVSASRDETGRIHISICNLDPENCAKLVCEIKGTKINDICGSILTADVMNAHNTFDEPESIIPGDFNTFKLEGGNVTVELPPKSVVVLETE